VDELGQEDGEDELNPNGHAACNIVLAHLKEKALSYFTFAVSPGPVPIPEVIMKGGQKDRDPERETEPPLLRMNAPENNLLIDGNEPQINACPQQADDPELEETMPYQGAHQGPLWYFIGSRNHHLHVLQIET
jgi:hypothetical protein